MAPHARVLARDELLLPEERAKGGAGETGGINKYQRVSKRRQNMVLILVDTFCSDTPFANAPFWGGATFLMLLVLCGLICCLHVFRRVKDHDTLLHYLPRLNKTSVRQVALDKWLPLIADTFYSDTHFASAPFCSPPILLLPVAALVAPVLHVRPNQ